MELAGVNRRRRARLDGSAAAVLMYHRVLPDELARARAVEPGMYVTPEAFRRHLQWLRDAFRVLPLGELVDRLAAGRPLDPRAVAISFDDGWRDGWTHALPELRRAGLPATVFLVSARVGSAGAFWPDEVCRALAELTAPERRALAAELGAAAAGDPAQALLERLKALGEAERERALERVRRAAPPAAPAERELLDWDEVAAMARAGVEFESHGRTHAILTGLSPEQQREELVRSLGELRERGYARGGLLAYPVGAHDAGVRARAAEAGYRAAFTMRPGLLRAGADVFSLARIALHGDVSATRAEFHERVPGAAD
jgi:peptidoglycan/xylan/chitin deacetylase (PgdA/CDA1 family)